MNLVLMAFMWNDFGNHLPHNKTTPSSWNALSFTKNTSLWFETAWLLFQKRRAVASRAK